MSSLGSPSPFFLAGKKGYEVRRSLRFNDDDSPVLTRTPSSASNRKTWTYSCWVKRSNLGTYQGLLAVGTGDGSEDFFGFHQDNKLYFRYSSSNDLKTSAVYRDVSAWLHIVVVADTTQSQSSATASDSRLRFYVNGQQITSFDQSNMPSQNDNFRINDTEQHYIGEYPRINSHLDGYLAEVNFLDGYSLDASYFGETDADTGQWNPKKYTGGYGSNGFYLNFSDNSGTTATTLGEDSSGNGNNFTPNNFSVSAGVGNDSLEDTPTNNFCTFNPLNVNVSNPVTYSEGNLQYNGVSGNNHLRSSATIPVSSGKWYVEFKMVSGYSSTDPTIRIGIITSSAGHRDSNNDGLYYENTNNATSVNYGASGAVYVSNTSQITGLTTYTNNDVMGIALDLDNDKFFVSKNGTFFSNGTGTQDPAAGTNPLYSGGVLTSRKSEGFEIAIQGYSDKVITADFGQQGFAYTPPTGFKAICTANLPDPAINFPKKHFDTVLYTGDGNATGSQTNVLEFQPDWLWSKPRNAAYVHLLYDSVRGAGNSKALNLGGGSPAGAGAEGAAADNATYGFLNSFDANGFSYTKGSATTTYFNQSGINYVVWNWNAGDTDGKTYTVTVVSDSGNKYRFDGFGTSAVTLDLAEGGTYIFDQSDASNATHPLRFYTAADKTGGEYTTGVTTAGTPGQAGAYTQIVVAASAPTLYYQCSAHANMGGQANTNSTLGSSNFDGSLQATVKANTTAGFSIGTYTAQSSGSATVGHGLGVAPDLVITKSRTLTSSWYSYHQAIGQDGWILLDSSGAATTGNSAVWNPAPTSSVFTYGSGLVNFGDVVFYAFSEVAGYSKFGSYIGNGNADGAFIFTGFRPALIILKRTDTANNWHIADNKRQNPFNVVTAQLYPNLVNAEVAQEDLDFVSNGFKIRNSAAFGNASGGTYIYLAFAESPFKYARAR